MKSEGNLSNFLSNKLNCTHSIFRLNCLRFINEKTKRRYKHVASLNRCIVYYLISNYVFPISKKPDHHYNRQYFYGCCKPSRLNEGELA